MPKYQIRLVLGDWSHDGHNQTDTKVINSSLNRDELIAAFQLGAAASGLLPQAQHHSTYLTVAEEYEDSKLARKEYARLAVLGVVPIDPNEFPFDEEIDREDDTIYLDEGSYTELWLAVAKFGNPALEYALVSDTMPSINIGGYGLLND
jgi:hypothetical protein